MLTKESILSVLGGEIVNAYTRIISAGPGSQSFYLIKHNDILWIDKFMIWSKST